MVDNKTGAYWDAYTVSKSAVSAMANLLAKEYEGSNLQVNCINPGKTKTGLHLRAYPAADENEGLAGPEVHADTFLYLMSDELKENGECFQVNSTT